MDVIRDHLISLYGESAGAAAFNNLRARLNASSPGHPSAETVPVGGEFQGKASHAPGMRSLSARDAILITYGDQLSEPDRTPLRTLAEFCRLHLDGVVSGVHLLPFYPYSSDDGFSVIDYEQVNPALGSWDDVAGVGQHFRLMFDAVINHISAESGWFKAFLQDDARYRNYFIIVEDDPDLSQVVRPRALPLLTEFTTPSGVKKVWTTFSADQIDLNYARPDVLLDIIDVLLFYAARGAEFIRLDAIAYLWKEIGTPCIHLPQTHRVIRLLRAVLDEVAPQVMLITETNVPHRDNISYFGDGHNEAQLVYNFALPPLMLHTFHTGDATALSHWAAGLERPDGIFFNFLASHDGVGLNPARGILRDDEIDALVQQAIAHGGRVSNKANPDGSTSPYELNINYFDALSDPNGKEALPVQIDRFVAAHAIMLALSGLPGIYFHSLFGSRSWPEGIAQLGYPRAINRQKLDRAEVERELADPHSLRAQVFQRLRHLLQVRAGLDAFDPAGPQQVIELKQAIFAVERGPVLCLHNVSSQPQSVTLDHNWQRARDLLSARRTATELTLQPYEVLWLQHE